MKIQAIFYVSSLMCIHSLNIQNNLHSDGLEWAWDSSDRSDRVIHKVDVDVALVMRVLRIKNRIGRVLRLNGGAPLLKIGGASTNASPKKQKIKSAKKKNVKNDASSASDEEEEEEGHWTPMCRICYEVDPAGLFVPCKCTGSMGFVHRLLAICD